MYNIDSLSWRPPQDPPAPRGVTPGSTPDNPMTLDSSEDEAMEVRQNEELYFLCKFVITSDIQVMYRVHSLTFEHWGN